MISAAMLGGVDHVGGRCGPSFPGYVLSSDETSPITHVSQRHPLVNILPTLMPSAHLESLGAVAALLVRHREDQVDEGVKPRSIEDIGSLQALQAGSRIYRDTGIPRRLSNRTLLVCNGPCRSCSVAIEERPGDCTGPCPWAGLNMSRTAACTPVDPCTLELSWVPMFGPGIWLALGQ